MWNPDTDERDESYGEETEDDGYWQAEMAIACPPAPPKPYTVTRMPTRTSGTGRYKIVKADGTVYYVTYGSAAMSCTCPDSRHRRPGKCKHCQHIALLIRRPELVAD